MQGVRELVGEELERFQGSGTGGEVQWERPIVGTFLQGLPPFGHEEADHRQGHAVMRSDVQWKASTSVPDSERFWALEGQEHYHLEGRVEVARNAEGGAAVHVPHIERGEPRVG